MFKPVENFYVSESQTDNKCRGAKSQTLCRVTVLQFSFIHLKLRRECKITLRRSRKKQRGEGVLDYRIGKVMCSIVVVSLFQRYVNLEA